MTNPFRGLIRLFRPLGLEGGFMTLDCRDANHCGCDGCNCSCHGGSIALRTDGQARAHI